MFGYGSTYDKARDFINEFIGEQDRMTKENCYDDDTVTISKKLLFEIVHKIFELDKELNDHSDNYKHERSRDY